LRSIVEKFDYTVLAKVNLSALVQPVDTNPRYNNLLRQIWCKRVDFVICDPELNARCVVELVPSAQYKFKQESRNKFVDSVLEEAGYDVLRVDTIDASVADWLSTRYAEAMKVSSDARRRFINKLTGKAGGQE